MSVVYIIAALGSIASLVALILKYLYGSGRLEAEYHEISEQLRIKQDERQVALLKNDWHNFHLLVSICNELSERKNNLRSRLQSRGIILK